MDAPALVAVDRFLLAAGKPVAAASVGSAIVRNTPARAGAELRDVRIGCIVSFARPGGIGGRASFIGATETAVTASAELVNGSRTGDEDKAGSLTFDEDGGAMLAGDGVVFRTAAVAAQLAASKVTKGMLATRGCDPGLVTRLLVAAPGPPAPRIAPALNGSASLSSLLTCVMTSAPSATFLQASGHVDPVLNIGGWLFDQASEA
ncbi:hypothetical protein [Lichenicola sp.]|uniref:hypothetical protein n=1 Tax=Lichenicola sp. TaxID=2804529 RepID=UPI003B002F03